MLIALLIESKGRDEKAARSLLVQFPKEKHHADLHHLQEGHFRAASRVAVFQPRIAYDSIVTIWTGFYSQYLCTFEYVRAFFAQWAGQWFRFSSIWA